MPWRLACLIVIAFSLGGWIGHWMADYRHSVHDEIVAAKFAQFEELKRDYERRFPMVTTASQARGIVGRFDKERNKEGR